MKKDINNIHDKSYKTLFSNKDIFLNLIQDFTDHTWSKSIHPENLILVDKSYILSDYEELEADIVYRGKVGDKEVIFYVLLEFQSSIDYSMPIRLLFYMVEIWRDVLKDVKAEAIKKKEFKLPAILPIVTYNGMDKWHVPRRFQDKIDTPELFGTNLLDFEYLLLDVNRYGKSELIEKQSIASAIFLLDQKTDVVEYLNRIATVAQEFNKLTDKEKLELKNWIRITDKEKLELKNWIRSTVQEELAEQAVEILESDKKEVESMVANITRTIEEMKEEAEHRGIEKGIQKGKQEREIELAKAFLDVLDEETIAIKTGLPLAIIQELREKNEL